MKGNFSPTSHIYPQQSQHLSNEEFESLKRVVQLLRISQLRYIVQKFSIPASGNKTKLLGLLLTIFQSLRYDKVLIDIYNEINNLLSKKIENSVKSLEIISQFDPSFRSPPNLLQTQSDPPFMLGPILIPPGQSSGKFGFMHSESNEDLSKSVNISFLFPGGKNQQFSLKGEINGIPFEVSIDDPYPQPIDITDYINTKTLINTLNITMINTLLPMMICVREYKFNGIQEMMNQVLGRAINIDEEDYNVCSNSCHHKDSFSLAPFLSRSLATGNFNCPICGQPIDPFTLTILGARDISKDMKKTDATPSTFNEIETSDQSTSEIMSPSETTSSFTSPFLVEPITDANQTSNKVSNKSANNSCDNNTENSNNSNDLFKVPDILPSFDWDR